MLVQLRLAKQYDLHQFKVAGLKVGQQPNLFEGLKRHGMRFIDQRHHLSPLRVDFDQLFLQRADQFGGRHTGRFKIEITSDGGEHLIAR